MGRHCRRVPPDWQHPRNEKGDHIPLFDETFAHAAAEWKEEFAAWERGEIRDHRTHGFKPKSEAGWTIKAQEFWQYAGDPPSEESYRPPYDAEATHFQMYEDCTEGTPISPVFATPEEVARWCADHGASAFGSMTAPYEAWLKVARGAASVGMEINTATGEMRSGVEAMLDDASDRDT